MVYLKRNPIAMHSPKPSQARCPPIRTARSAKNDAHARLSAANLRHDQGAMGDIGIVTSVFAHCDPRRRT